jgi:cobalt-zinc-cadmium efflux system outer membrane protein
MRYEMLTIIVGAGVISGCATVPQGAGFREVSQAVEQRTGLQVHWDRGTSEDALVAETLRALLKEPLTPEAAVQVALLNNASLQGTFEELGIAQADLVQAGLLKNPVFAGHVRFPDKSGESTNTEFSISQDFLDILFRPMRKKLAAAQFEQARLRVSDEVLRFSAEVRSVYYTLQGAEHAHRMLTTMLQAAQAAAEFSERQHAAGNINDLDVAREQAGYQQAKLDVARIKAEVLAQRERLNRLMGLQEKPSWELSEKLPELPPAAPPWEDLEATALSQRLDLAAARQEIKVLEHALALARRGVIPEVNVGFDTEREPDGTRLTGPSFEVPVPVFDQRQAGIARAEAQLRQARRRVSSLETQVRSEVRSAQDRLLVARELIERYRDTLIPLRETIVAESQKHYNFMLIGVFQLLDAKREEVNAYREYIEAFRDYWNAHAELERAAGGRLEHAVLNGGGLQ